MYYHGNMYNISSIYIIFHWIAYLPRMKKTRTKEYEKSAKNQQNMTIIFYLIVQFIFGNLSCLSLFIISPKNIIRK